MSAPRPRPTRGHGKDRAARGGVAAGLIPPAAVERRPAEHRPESSVTRERARRKREGAPEPAPSLRGGEPSGPTTRERARRESSTTRERARRESSTTRERARRGSSAAHARPAAAAPAPAAPAVELPPAGPTARRYFGATGLVGGAFLAAVLAMFFLDEYFTPERREALAEVKSFEPTVEVPKEIEIDKGLEQDPLLVQLRERLRPDLDEAIRRNLLPALERALEALRSVYEARRAQMEPGTRSSYEEALSKAHLALAGLRWQEIQSAIDAHQQAPRPEGFRPLIDRVQAFLDRHVGPAYEGDLSVARARRGLGELYGDLWTDHLRPAAERLWNEQAWADAAQVIDQALPPAERKRWGRLYTDVMPLREKYEGRNPLEEAAYFAMNCRDNALPFTAISGPLKQGQTPPVSADVFGAIQRVFGAMWRAVYKTLFDAVNTCEFRGTELGPEWRVSSASLRIAEGIAEIPPQYSAYYLAVPVAEAADFMIDLELLSYEGYLGLYVGRLLPFYNEVAGEDSWNLDEMALRALPGSDIAEVYANNHGQALRLIVTVKGPRLAYQLSGAAGVCPVYEVPPLPVQDLRAVVIMFHGYGKARVRNIRYKELPEE